MAKLPKEGKRVNIYLPPKQLAVAKQIDNLSAFIQLALDQAPGLMAWAMLQERDPKKYTRKEKLEEVVDGYNEKYPQDPLTQKRTGKWPQGSPPNQDNW